MRKLAFVAALALVHSAHGAQNVIVAVTDCPSGQTLIFDSNTKILTCGSAAPPTPIPPTPVPTTKCTNADYIQDVPWPASGQIKVSTTNFGGNVVSFRLVIPSALPVPGPDAIGFVHMFEVPGQQATAREVEVSKISCDFDNGILSRSGGTAPGFNWALNRPVDYRTLGASVNFASGDVWFVNVKNSYQNKPTCTQATCNLRFDYATPFR